VLYYDDGGVGAREMPEEYVKEMLADWRGAGRAIKGYDETKEWYLGRKDTMLLNVNTRKWIEKELGISVE
jgi:hypothetical protein